MSSRTTQRERTTARTTADATRKAADTTTRRAAATTQPSALPAAGTSTASPTTAPPARFPGSAIPSAVTSGASASASSASSSISSTTVGAIAGACGAVVLIGAVAALFILRRRRAARRRFGPAFYDSEGRRRSRTSKGLFPLSSEADDEVKSKGVPSSIAPSSSISVRHRSRDYGSPPGRSGMSPGPFQALMRDAQWGPTPPLSPPESATAFSPLPYVRPAPRVDALDAAKLRSPTSPPPQRPQSDDAGPRAFAFPPVPMRSRSDTISDPDFSGVISPSTYIPPPPTQQTPPRVELQRQASNDEILIVNPGRAASSPRQLGPASDVHSRQASFSTLPPSPQHETLHHPQQPMPPTDPYSIARAQHNGARPESIAILQRATAHANRMSVVDEPVGYVQGGPTVAAPPASDVSRRDPQSQPDQSTPTLALSHLPLPVSSTQYAQYKVPSNPASMPPSPALLSPSIFSSFDHSLLDLGSPTPSEAARSSSFVVTPTTQDHFDVGTSAPPPPTPAAGQQTTFKRAPSPQPQQPRVQSVSGASILDSYGAAPSNGQGVAKPAAQDPTHKPKSPSISSNFLDALMGDDDEDGQVLPPHLDMRGGGDRSSSVPEQLADQQLGRAS